MSLRCFLAAASLVLGGCAVGPEYHPPAVPTPAAFGTGGDFVAGAPLLRWWQVLGDDNLTALIERALGGTDCRADCGANPDVQGAEARIRAARAELGMAAAATDPQVSAAAQVSRDRFSRNSEEFANLPFGNPRATFTDWRAGFDASWELDVFGRTRRAVEAASARLQGAEASARDLRIVIAAEVARTYIALRQTEAQVALAERDLSDLAQTARLVGLRREAGNASLLEWQRADAAEQAQSAVLDGLRVERAAARNALAVLIGASVEQTEGLVAPGRPVPSVAPGRVAVGLPSELLRRRPDVIRAERDLAAATADIGVATADLYPRFELVGNLGVDSIRPGDLGSQASRAWSVGPQLSLPVLGRGRLRSEVARQEALRDAAIAGYRKAILQAMSDVETAMIGFDRERARAASTERTWRDLEGAAALTREQFEAGRSSRLEVLDAERQARRAEEDRTEAAGRLATQLVALYKALGGGWEGGK
jgi:NodT family efflux transporter outer membrane factor (OMF) lipoprotein